MILVSSWTCDPALAALFVPSRSEIGRYEVCTTTDPMATVVAQEASAGLHVSDVEPLDAPDAFGAAGSYNRAALARLYVGTPVRVARGWATRGDRFEAVTLLSPYPNLSLTELQPGTMAIRFTMERGAR